MPLLVEDLAQRLEGVVARQCQPSLLLPVRPLAREDGPGGGVSDVPGAIAVPPEVARLLLEDVLDVPNGHAQDIRRQRASGHVVLE
eukprot:9934250-Alexandrium_andersonii.AAC.1